MPAAASASSSSRDARERGVRGVKDTVEALQEGRVYQLIALWDLDSGIRWCDHDELAITEAAREECPYCGRDTRVRPLTDVLVDLAVARDARVELVRAQDPVVGTPALRVSKGTRQELVYPVGG